MYKHGVPVPVPPTIILPAVFALISTVLAIKFIMPYFYNAGIIAADMNKEKVKKIPGSGGVTCSLRGHRGHTCIYFRGIIPVSGNCQRAEHTGGTALSILLISAVGFIDDLNIKSVRVDSTGKGINMGLKQWQKPLLTILGALPLMAINAGVSTITDTVHRGRELRNPFPARDHTHNGDLRGNAYNLLGGFNGLEATTGLIAGMGFMCTPSFTATA